MSRKKRSPLPKGWIRSKDGKPLSPTEQLGNVVDGICEDPLFELDYDVEEERKLSPIDVKEALRDGIETWTRTDVRHADEVRRKRKKARGQGPSRVN